MIVRSGLIKKKPDWTGEDFRRYWREHHGALAAELPGLVRYEQNHITDHALAQAEPIEDLQRALGKADRA